MITILKGTEIFGSHDEDIYIEMAVDIQGDTPLKVMASYQKSIVTQGNGVATTLG